MKRNVKYTKELLEPLVKESISVAQVIRKLGLREAGGTHTHLSSKFKKYSLNTSHFLGRAANCGKNHKGSKKKKWQEILIKRKGNRRQKAYQLRRALIESGREYICECCGQKPEWNGKELRLQVDHKNGDWLDDQPDNLGFLCPNCHTQTDGFSGSKGYSELTSTANYAKGLRERRKKTGRVA